MRSWPSPYLPPAPTGISHPDLKLIDSYTGGFIELSTGEISTYVCGITPYDATHLGHASTYLAFDLVHRYLVASGSSLNFVENITDIDDPLLERAARDSQAWSELAENQIELFRADMTALRVISPISYRGVVESMPGIIEDIQSLVNKGITYEIQGDIYLALGEVPGAIEKLPMSLSAAIEIFAERGGDPSRIGKKHPLDTLLWQSRKGNEPYWQSPFGDGRPGWHIECVSIATRNSPAKLNTCISLQGGGSDLIFPHHYMTNVQARALTGKEFAAGYVHAGMIGLDGEKMSKSRGNLVFVSKLLESGLDPMIIRTALMQRHYQSDTMWTTDLVDSANAVISRIRQNLARELVAPTHDSITEIVNALSDNLDTVRVFTTIESWCAATEAGDTGGSAGEMSRALDLYLGLTL